MPGRARIRQAAGDQQPEILLGSDDGDRFLARAGCDDDFGENVGDGARGIGIERPVHRHDTAEGRHGVAGQRLAIGFEQACALGDPARIGVLDDHAGGGAGGIELGDAFIGRVGVVDVVVGELLALDLPRGGNAGTALGCAVERRRLMRVLAVAQRLDETSADGTESRRGIRQLVREPVGDRGVISAGAGIGLGGEPAA